MLVMFVELKISRAGFLNKMSSLVKIPKVAKSVEKVTTSSPGVKALSLFKLILRYLASIAPFLLNTTLVL